MNTATNSSSLICARRLGRSFSIVVAFWGMGLVIAMSAAGPSWAASSDSSLSGLAYYPYDGKNWGICGVTIDLYNNASTTPIATTKTSATGEYTFSNLAAGNYKIVNPTPNASWVPQLGAVNNAFVGTVDDAEDSIGDIILNGVDSGIQYNFEGDRYPIQLVSKRMLITSDPANLHFANVVPVPEPGTIMMLILGAFAVGGWTAAKRYFRRA